jgi:hypothetical protein
VDVPVRFVMLIDGPGGALEIKPPKSGFVNNSSNKPSATDEPTDSADTTKEEDTKPTNNEPTDTGPSDSETPEAPDKTGGSSDMTPVADVKLGEATEYVPMKSGSTMSIGGTPLLDFPATGDGVRLTIVVGTNTDGKIEATGFKEKDGKVIGEFGTGKLADSPPLKDGKATVFGSGIGLGTAKEHKSTHLGVVDKGCLADMAITAKDTLALAADPGDVEIGWFGDDKCKSAAGDTQKVTLKAGQQAYAFAWSVHDADPKLVFIPIDRP